MSESCLNCTTEGRLVWHVGDSPCPMAPLEAACHLCGKVMTTAESPERLRYLLALHMDLSHRGWSDAEWLVRVGAT